MNLPIVFKPFIDSPKTHNIFEGGRGGGKTRSIASLIIEVMNVAPINVICGREIQNSLRESSFLVLANEIHRKGYTKSFNIKKGAGIIESHTGGRCVFIGLQQHTVDSIKSYEGFHWAWIEEAQAVSKQSLETLIPTLRTDKHFKVTIGGYNMVFPCRMFMYTMNPYTWDDPIKIVLPESRADTRYIKINHYDNPWFPESLESERLEAKKTMTPEEYARIWEGVPYENAENAIMQRQDIQDAMNRQASQDGGIVVGADIARFGDDRTEFMKRRGMQVIDTMTLVKKDTQEVARQLANFAQGGKIIVDDTGVGGGVTDKLRDMGCNVVPINFGSKAINKTKYPDIISEMWFQLADQIDQIGLPDDQELLAELSSRYYRYTNDERRKVESKDDFKKRSGRRSPDKADACILCFYNDDSSYVTPSTVSAGSFGL